MKCFRCLKQIDKKGQYYAMTEYSKGIKLKTDYVHKSCWDSLMESLDKASTSLQKSNVLLDALGNQMTKMGWLKKEEEVAYEIK